MLHSYLVLNYYLLVCHLETSAQQGFINSSHSLSEPVGLFFIVFVFVGLLGFVFGGLFWWVFFVCKCVCISFFLKKKKQPDKHKAMKCTRKACLMDYKRGWGEAEGLSRSGEREEFSHVQVLSFRCSSIVDPFGFSADTVCSKAVTIWEHWTAAAKCRRYEMLWYYVDLETL